MKDWNLIKDDASHWHFEQTRTAKGLEKLERYDLQLTLVANPLNWDFGRFNDYSGVSCLSVGPFRFMIFYG